MVAKISPSSVPFAPPVLPPTCPPFSSVLAIKTVISPLDAGYITKSLITAYNADDKIVEFTGRMPARKGFQFKTLYHR